MTPVLPMWSHLAAGRYASPGTPPDRVPARPRKSVRDLEARVRRYNSDIDPASDTFRAAVLLLASLEFGQNVEGLARRTGFPRSFVAKCARRLIDNGVWVGGETAAEWSADDEASGAFWNDVAVAEGKLCRRVGAAGEIEWAPAGYWKKNYEFIETAEQPLSAVYRDPVPPEAEPAAPAADVANDEPSTPAAAIPAADEPASAPEGATPPDDDLFPGTVWLGSPARSGF